MKEEGGSEVYYSCLHRPRWHALPHRRRRPAPRVGMGSTRVESQDLSYKNETLHCLWSPRANGLEFFDKEGLMPT